MRALQLGAADFPGAPDQDALRQIAALDQHTIALARRLLDETGRELEQLRQGRAALRGYGRPGAQLAYRPALIDQAR